jgi:hypothetical protein
VARMEVELGLTNEFAAITKDVYSISL